MAVDEHTIEVAGAPAFFRRAAGAGEPVLYLHSVPTSSDDWCEMLELTGGVAPDLPGFGRSGKGGNLACSLDFYVDWIEEFLARIDEDRVALAGHGWGATIGLLLSRRRPERVSRLALIDPVAPVEGLEWPGPVRWWRRPVVGELLMGSVNRWLLARTLRQGAVSPEAWPDDRVDAVWEQFDQGTQRAILRLHRSVDLPGLTAAGAGLAGLKQPVLILWGDSDPWLPAALAERLARQLGHATVERVAGAGHWPWLDRPELIARLAAWALEQQPA